MFTSTCVALAYNNVLVFALSNFVFSAVFSFCVGGSVGGAQQFSTSMSVAELNLWLLSNNMPQQDCDVIKSELCFALPPPPTSLHGRPWPVESYFNSNCYYSCLYKQNWFLPLCMQHTATMIMLIVGNEITCGWSCQLLDHMHDPAHELPMSTSEDSS